jgi:hypothetical protein
MLVVVGDFYILMGAAFDVPADHKARLRAGIGRS